MRIRELDRAWEAVALLEPHEPASSLMLAPILEGGLTRTLRCWLAESPDGRPAGLLVTGRYFPGRWFCRPLVIDSGAALPLARIASHAPESAMHGPAEHVEPLLPHLGLDVAMSEPFLRLPRGRTTSDTRTTRAFGWRRRRTWSRSSTSTGATSSSGYRRCGAGACSARCCAGG